MFCQQCGALVEEGQTFCYDCSVRMFVEPQAPSHAPGDAHAGPPGGQGASPEHVSRYLDQHSAPAASNTRPGAENRVVGRSDDTALVQYLGITIMACGAFAAAATFLRWINSHGFDFLVAVNPTGWHFVTGGSGAGGNVLFVRGGGVLYFSGLWSLAAGLVMVAGAVLLLLGFRQGARISGIAGIVGAGVAMLNLVMTFKLRNGIGYGLWLLMLSSVVAVVCSELAGRKA